MVRDISIIRNGQLSGSELNELFETNNWRVEPVEKLDKSLQLSWGWITARTKELKLIGFVQVISDAIFHAYIFRMIVHPDFRRQGIRTAIMDDLMKMLKENNLKPTLVAVPGKENFYGKFGFSSNYNGFTAMCIR